MAELSGRRVLVLGAETAVGRAVAVALAEAGAEVAIVAATATTEAEFAVNSALNELWALDRRGLALAIDASDAAQVRGAVERAERELGRLDGAAVVAREGGAVAVDALREALGGRPVVVVEAGASAEDAVTLVSASLPSHPPAQ
jgi:NAD(P)-dependent dehydrogenase (short-subunit alcohol dehydrogenase family)